MFSEKAQPTKEKEDGDYNVRSGEVNTIDQHVDHNKVGLGLFNGSEQTIGLKQTNLDKRKESINGLVVNNKSGCDDLNQKGPSQMGNKENNTSKQGQEEEYSDQRRQSKDMKKTQSLDAGENRRDNVVGCWNSGCNIERMDRSRPMEAVGKIWICSCDRGIQFRRRYTNSEMRSKKLRKWQRQQLLLFGFGRDGVKFPAGMLMIGGQFVWKYQWTVRGPDTDVVFLDRVGMKRCCRTVVEGKESQLLEGRQRGEESVGSHDGTSLGGVCTPCNLSGDDVADSVCFIVVCGGSKGVCCGL
ncbi:hypothetical protein L6452_21886 [Arctium lappa]|uniref:Uncharacterized protein n=1 Tax=Arctium lappa TaxID=4217 RepID=A0ACB9AZ38_ARCLA|nr:hypothetical protein L6452_21886 [Arctium lappa]